MPLALELENVRKVFPGRYGEADVIAVNGINLSVDCGEIFGFLGRNGAGKTTTIRILLNMIPRYDGGARLFGVSAKDPRARREVGYLAETPEFPPYLKPRELLSFHGRLAGLNQRAIAEQAGKLLSALDLHDSGHRRVRGLSKGMRQRLGIAVALMGRPKLVFLDEPTANLDPVGRRKVRDLLLDLKEQGTTVFINSHMLSEIEMTCTRVAIMNLGQIVRQGSVEDLTQAEHYVHVGVTRITDGLLEAIRRVAKDVRVMQGYIVGRIEREEDLDPIPSLVESHGARLRYLAMARETLEDAFMKVVGAEGEHQ